MPEGTCEAIWFVLFILVGAVCNLQTYELCGTVMPRLRRLNRLCSSTVADTANRLLMRTDTEGSPSVAEEKSSAVPHFRSGRRSLIFAGLTNKGKVGVQRGRETAGVPSFLPLRRAPQSPALRRAQLPAEVQQKNSRPLGANTLTQFECPAQPVLKNSRPLGANRLRSSSTPLSRC